MKRLFSALALTVFFAVPAASGTGEGFLAVANEAKALLPGESLFDWDMLAINKGAGGGPMAFDAASGSEYVIVDTGGLWHICVNAKTADSTQLRLSIETVDWDGSSLGVQFRGQIGQRDMCADVFIDQGDGVRAIIDNRTGTATSMLPYVALSRFSGHVIVPAG